MVRVGIDHVGIQCDDKEKAFLFYQNLCGLEYVKSTMLSKDLVNKIFKIDTQVEMLVFKNKDAYFEIFISNADMKRNFSHVCLFVDDVDSFFKSCRNAGLNPFTVQKNDKELFFIHDFSGNLFEIKQSK